MEHFGVVKAEKEKGVTMRKVGKCTLVYLPQSYTTENLFSSYPFILFSDLPSWTCRPVSVWFCFKNESHVKVNEAWRLCGEENGWVESGKWKPMCIIILSSQKGISRFLTTTRLNSKSNLFMHCITFFFEVPHTELSLRGKKSIEEHVLQRGVLDHFYSSWFRILLHGCHFNIYIRCLILRSLMPVLLYPLGWNGTLDVKKIMAFCVKPIYVQNTQYKDGMEATQHKTCETTGFAWRKFLKGHDCGWRPLKLKKECSILWHVSFQKQDNLRENSLKVVDTGWRR